MRCAWYTYRACANLAPCRIKSRMLCAVFVLSKPPCTQLQLLFVAPSKSNTLISCSPMATIISSPSSSVYNSKHFLTTSAHDTYSTFHTRPNQQSMPHAHNGFSAFSHGHGYARSSSLASSSTSWRTRAAAPALEPAPAPIPRITPFKRSQKAFTSTSRHRHSASQSSSSDESTASWRSSDASALNHTATHSASVPAATASGVCYLLTLAPITQYTAS